MATFNVTYEIVTPESAEHGDADERGFIAENVTLRDAVEYLFATRTNQCDGITGIEDNDNSITVYNGGEYLTGAYENRAIHFPDNTTDSTRNRIARLINA